MATFKDSGGTEHALTFDAFILDQLRLDCDVDLADLGADGYYRVMVDDVLLVKVLAIVCEQDFRQFAKMMRGDAIAKGRAAVEAALADFFPKSTMSAMRSNLERRKKGQTIHSDATMIRDMWEVIEPILPMFRAIQDMPEGDFKRGALDEVKKQIEAAGGDSGDLESLLAFASAGGPDATLPKPATDSAENAEPVPAS